MFFLPGPAKGWNRLFLSFFQSLVSRVPFSRRCDKIVVIVTLLEAIEGIPDKDFITLGLSPPQRPLSCCCAASHREPLRRRETLEGTKTS